MEGTREGGSEGEYFSPRIPSVRGGWLQKWGDGFLQETPYGHPLKKAGRSHPGFTTRSNHKRAPKNKKKSWGGGRTRGVNRTRKDVKGAASQVSRGYRKHVEVNEPLQGTKDMGVSSNETLGVPASGFLALKKKDETFTNGSTLRT